MSALTTVTAPSITYSGGPFTASPALLVLEDGRAFRGRTYGAAGEAFGEAVFCTAMTGYQETLTDPSYHRQVVVQTAPHIGNTGVNVHDGESDRMWPAGYVVRDPSRLVSSWRSQGPLDDELRRNDVVGISGVDTRALTRHLRDRGVMRVGISTLTQKPDELLNKVLASPQMTGADLTAEVSTPHPYIIPAVGDTRFTVAVLDLGIKAMTGQRMSERGIEVHVLPSTASVDDIYAVRPDGIFLSNGPGDPATADSAIALTKEVVRQRTPLLGICFGHQILGRAAGFDTYKLSYGHRGINQPVRDVVTGKVAISSHNHGFAVDAPRDRTSRTALGRVDVSHVALNDDVVEGLRLLDAPAFSVQYHPEAAAGPHDASYLFDDFVDLMAAHASSAMSGSS